MATFLIICHFDYACSHGLRVSRSTYKKLQILQNKTMRFFLSSPSRSHICIEEFTLLHWIPVCPRGKQIKLNNMYRIVHGNALQYLKPDISMVNDQHSLFTRNSFLSVVLPHVKSSGKKTFNRFSAGKIWNALPVSLRSAEDLLSFKKGVNKASQRGANY